MQTKVTTQLSRSLFVLLCIAVIAGCGFKLRGGQPLPPGVTQLSVTSAVEHGPLHRALTKQIDLYQITQVKELTSANQDKTIAIRLLPDTLDRRLLSLFPTGQVAEYELVLSVRYQVIFPGQDIQDFSFDITREYQDDPDAILAKSRELDLVLSEMRQRAADNIIRLLVSQNNQVQVN